MIAGGYLSGDAARLKRYKIGSSFSTKGVIAQAGSAAGIIPATTTSFADSPGLALDTATYTTTQATVLSSGEAMVMVDVHPLLVVRALMCGGATDGTALTTLTNTSASSGGTVCTDATNVGTASMATGTLYCTSGNNVGQSRVITTFSSGASETVTVPFPYEIG